MATRKQPFKADKQIEFLDLLNREVKPFIPFIESHILLGLEPLLSHLKYIFLSDHDILLVIISLSWNAKQENSLVAGLWKCKKVIR